MSSGQNFSNLLAEPLSSFLSQESSISSLEYTPLTVVHDSCQPDFDTLSRPYEKSTLDSEQQNEIIEISKVRPRNAPWGARLPGSGAQPELCGSYKEYYCLDEQKAFWHARSCRQRECPVCYELWGEKEASKASRRVWAGLVKELAQGHDSVVIHHCVVSFSFHGQAFEEAKDQARHVARAHGSVGEAIIPHPFRNKDDSEDPDYEGWIMDGTVHFHMICVFPTGWFLPSTSGQPYIFKVIPNPHTGRLGDGFQSIQEVKDCFAYQLSHAGVIEGRHAVTWSGSLAYNKLTKAELAQVPEFLEKRIKCPRCGGYNTEPCYQRGIEQNEVTGRADRRLELVHPPPDDPPPFRLQYVVRWYEGGEK